MKKIYLYISFIFLLLHSCIDEYSPSGVKNLSNLLVVEGIITEGENSIKLSRSVGIDTDISDVVQITDAEVYIESSTGELFQLPHSAEGEYITSIDKLNLDNKYRVKIKIDDKEYQSEFSTPQQTPDIEVLEWRKDALMADAYLRLESTNQHESQYYKWSYAEIWEFASPIIPSGYEDPISKEFIPYTKANPNLGIYCWSYNNSHDLLIDATDKLSENKIVTNLLEVRPSSNRFSFLYYVKVKQNCLSKAAYDYYANMKRNIEDTGSIFGPIPTEMRGNIICTTDASIPVIGYIDVSKTATKEIWLTGDNNIYESDIFCKTYSDKDIGFHYSMILIDVKVSPPPVSEIIRTYTDKIQCVDCRTLNGSKLKPDFWPNNHK